MLHSLDPNPEKHLSTILCNFNHAGRHIVTLMGYSCLYILDVLKHFAGSHPSNEMLSGFIQLLWVLSMLKWLRMRKDI